MSEIIPMPHPEQNLSLHNSSRWGLRLQQVWDATEPLVPEQKAALRWLDGHARDNNMSRKEVARCLIKEDGTPYAEASVYNYLTGRAVVGTDFIRAIENFRKPLALRSKEDFPFVETALAQSIFAYCDATVRARRIGSIFGENQVGKTTALKQYALEHDGQATYIRMPTWGQSSEFTGRLCRAFNMSTKNRIGYQRERLLELLKPSMLLIIDELHQCFVGDSPRVRTIEFIREIYDECRCPIVVCGTDVARKGIHGNQEYDKLFAQFRNRGIEPYQLKNESKPTKKDLNLFAKKLDLAPAEGEALTLQTAIIAKFGLGKWLTYLLTGRTNAQNAGHALTWDDVLTADATFQAMGGGK